MTANSRISSPSNGVITLSDGGDLVFAGWNGESYLLRNIIVTDWQVGCHIDTVDVTSFGGKSAAVPIGKRTTAQMGLVALGGVEVFDGSVQRKELQQYSVLDMMRIINKRLAERE